jgi:hypothetical protein
MSDFDWHFRFMAFEGDYLQFGKDWGVNEFPDGQNQFWIEGAFHGRVLSLECSLPTPAYLDIFQQIQSTVGLRSVSVKYLYGARCDKGRADSRIVCDVAERMVKMLTEPNRGTDVKVLAPHCHRLFADSQQQWIIDPELCESKRHAVWLYPDQSASERFSRFVPAVEQAVCSKHRDQVTGAIIGHEIPDIKSDDVVVIDDLCDGGRTFLNIADALPGKRLTLSVTHGVFSNGAVDKLLERYESIYVSNSLPLELSTDRVHVMNVWESSR